MASSSIFPRVSKRTGKTTYEARWGANPKTGRPFTKNFKKRKDAVTHLSTVGASEYVPDRESITVEEAFKNWLKVCETTGRGDRAPVGRSSLRHYRMESAKVIGLVLDDGRRVGDIKLTKLNKALLMAIRTSLLENETRDQARRALDRFREALHEARQWELMAHDPFEFVPKIGMDDRGDDECAIPEPPELTAMFNMVAEMANHQFRRHRSAWGRWRMMFETLAYTGMRPGEMRGFARKHVLGAQCVIQIRQRADTDTIAIDNPKTRAGNRDVVVPRSFMDRLLAYMEATPADDDSPVFRTDNGGPLFYSHFRGHCWVPLMRRCGLIDPATGLPKYTPYALRHNYASNLIDMGANPKQLQRAMGHKKIETTMNTYGHLYDKKKQANQAVAFAEEMDRRFTGSEAPAAEQTRGENVVSGTFGR